MPDPTINITVPADTWTKAAEGPCEALVASNDSFESVYGGATAPSPKLIGNPPSHREVVVLAAGEAFWVRKARIGLILAVTVEGA